MFFTEIAAVGDLPDHAGDVLLQECLRCLQLVRNLRQKREELVTDGIHREAAVDVQRGAEMIGLMDLFGSRVLRLQHGVVGGGDGIQAKTSEGQEGQDGFHECSVLGLPYGRVVL